MKDESRKATLVLATDDDRSIELEINDIDDMKDLVNAFRTILFHITYTEDTIDKYVPNPYDTEDRLEEEEMDIDEVEEFLKSAFEALDDKNK